MEPSDDCQAAVTRAAKGTRDRSGKREGGNVAWQANVGAIAVEMTGANVAAADVVAAAAALATAALAAAAAVVLGVGTGAGAGADVGAAAAASAAAEKPAAYVGRGVRPAALGALAVTPPLMVLPDDSAGSGSA
jgi:hypothetical protein